MATLVVHCDGPDWGSDFVPLYPWLRRHYLACFRQASNPADQADEACSLLMIDFRRQWAPNAILALSTVYAARSVRSGRRLCGSGHHGGGPGHRSVVATRLSAGAGATHFRHFLDLNASDIRMAICNLPEPVRGWVELLCSGWSMNEISRQQGRCKRTVRLAVRAAVAELLDVPV